MGITSNHRPALGIGLATLLVAAVVVALPPQPVPAEAAAADPVRERAVVTTVLDGDTVDVLVDGRSTETRIRVSGIQAFEIGECGSDIATERLRELLEGERVELRARVASASSLGRPIRSLHVRSGGRMVDATEVLLEEGYGLWFPMEPEITDTADYHVAATIARAHRRGIWQDDLCGQGPQHGHPIEIWVKSDADGVDNDNLNDEYAVIVNRDPHTTLNLDGWLLRESSQFRHDPQEEGFRFPTGTRVPPGERIIVRVGSGRNTATEFFMGSPDPLFDNADRSLGTTRRPVENLGMGDGVYLLDPRGNVRESYTWPCVVDCDSPLEGSLVIDHVEYDPPGVDTADNEYVRLRNVSNEVIWLDGYQLRNVFVFHEFDFGTYLEPNETLTVFVGHGTSSRTVQYWGQPDAILRNGGDRVDVVSFDERYVDCVDWGTGRDCPWPVQVPGAERRSELPPPPEPIRPEIPVDTSDWVFEDVPPDAVHAESIEWLVEQAITSGCGDNRYCPPNPVTRAQMATFLVAALELEPAEPWGFADVPSGLVHAPAIDALAAAGVTSGCGGNDYCPSDPVTRAQMATFLVKALELEPAELWGFADVPSGLVHAPAIDALAAAGVTSGCGGNDYCPSDPVTRAQMATFLVTALELEPAELWGFADVPSGLVHAPAIDALAAAGVTSGCGGNNFCPSDPVTRAQMATFLRAALS